MPDEKEMYLPKGFVVPSGIAVYQPAVPFRAVEVIKEEDGTFSQEELVVIGIQVIVGGHWRHRRKLPNNVAPNDPTSFDVEDCRSAGYGFDAVASDTKSVDHAALIWTDDMGIVTTDFAETRNTRIVSGPATQPSTAWEAMVAEAIEDLRRRQN